MAVTLDSSIGKSTSNSYVDTDYASDYWENHFSAAKAAQWAALGDDQQAQLLVQACRVIETARYTHFVSVSEYTLHYDSASGQVIDLALTAEPVKYYYNQKLQFPRNLDVDDAGKLYIPEPVKMAQCEQAIYLLNFDETAMANRLQGVVSDSVSVGRGQIHLNQQYVSEGSSFAPMALEFVRPFFVKGARMRRA